MSQPIAGTVVEAYLRGRGITALHGVGNLRFHPRCYYRPDQYAPTETWPAMIAAVTDLAGQITGAHRTWLDPSGRGKAPVDTPKRAMGHLLGNAVRFDVAHDVMAAGESTGDIVLYEKVGVAGKRFAVTSMANVQELTEAELKKAVPDAK